LGAIPNAEPIGWIDEHSLVVGLSLQDGNFKIFSIKNKKLRNFRTLRGITDWALERFFLDPDGKKALYLSFNEPATIFDLREGRVVKKLDFPFIFRLQWFKCGEVVKGKAKDKKFFVLLSSFEVSLKGKEGEIIGMGKRHFVKGSLCKGIWKFAVTGQDGREEFSFDIGIRVDDVIMAKNDKAVLLVDEMERFWLRELKGDWKLIGRALDDSFTMSEGWLFPLDREWRKFAIVGVFHMWRVDTKRGEVKKVLSAKDLWQRGRSLLTSQSKSP